MAAIALIFVVFFLHESLDVTKAKEEAKKEKKEKKKRSFKEMFPLMIVGSRLSSRSDSLYDCRVLQPLADQRMGLIFQQLRCASVWSKVCAILVALFFPCDLAFW